MSGPERSNSGSSNPEDKNGSLSGEEEEEERDEVREMYAKVDLSKKRKDKVKPEDDQYGQEIVQKFSSYFAQNLEGEELEEELRVSHC